MGTFQLFDLSWNNQEVDYEQTENNDAIRLITIHQSKGVRISRGIYAISN